MSIIEIKVVILRDERKYLKQWKDRFHSNTKYFYSKTQKAASYINRPFPPITPVPTSNQKLIPTPLNQTHRHLPIPYFIHHSINMVSWQMPKSAHLAFFHPFTPSLIEIVIAETSRERSIRVEVDCMADHPDMEFGEVVIG